MNRPFIRGLAAFSVLFAGLTALAENASPESQRAAGEKALGSLSVDDQQRLRDHGVLIAGREFRQLFSAYIFSEMPVFVTSDSLLGGYHLLFEESVATLEKGQAARLGPLVEKMWRRLAEAEPSMTALPASSRVAAARRARLVLGVARVLLGQKIAGAPAGETELIEAEAHRVEQAGGFGKPAWLGPSEPDFLGLDYSRFQPRGFYTRNERLTRYFRALSWLQAVPFRLANDDELAAIALLGDSLKGSKDWKETARDEEVFHRYAALVGGLDDWDAVFAARTLQAGDSLKKMRERIQERQRYTDLPQINDQLRFAPDNPRAAAEPNFRMVSAYRLPDAVLFQRTTKPRVQNRDWPCGLDLAAALGSELAAQELARTAPEAVAAVIESRALFRPNVSLYHDYLHCVAALFEAPEAQAPRFMGSEAWRAKSLNTALAGWAQLRHTWVLQGKESVFYAGMGEESASFVEPAPEFFARLSRLIERTIEFFESDGALAIPAEEFAPGIRRAVEFLRKTQTRVEADQRSEEQRKRENKEQTPEEIEREVAEWDRLEHDAREVLDPIAPLLATMEGGPRYSWSIIPENIPSVCRQLEALLPVGQSPAAARALAEGLAHGERSLLARWRILQSLCHRLESLAGKQLRGAEFDADDQRFLRTYGQPLATAMFYDGNSWENPRDDAPRAIDVFSGAGEWLHAAVGRPRAIFVLYPWKGREVLCRGAVLPYFEFRQSARLTDEAWRTMVRDGKAPSLPAWSAAAFGAVTVSPRR